VSFLWRTLLASAVTMALVIWAAASGDRRGFRAVSWVVAFVIAVVVTWGGVLLWSWAFLGAVP
jgi:hypothetical protein